MPRSRLLLPLICSLALLPLMSTAEPSPPPAIATGVDYGIELGASYPGTTVQTLLEAADEEAGGAIEDAYAEGYKAGVLEVAPDRDYWKTRAETTRRRELEIFLTGGSAGGLAVAIAVAIIHIIAR